MKKMTQTILVLPDQTKRMARMSAVLRGLSMSDYVTQLILADCSEYGIDKLVDTEMKEVDCEKS